jgi:hypothetical protein
MSWLMTGITAASLGLQMSGNKDAKKAGGLLGLAGMGMGMSGGFSGAQGGLGGLMGAGSGAIPPGMASAGGMASGVGTAGGLGGASSGLSGLMGGAGGGSGIKDLMSKFGLSSPSLGAIPPGMATAGGMASGVGTAGAITGAPEGLASQLGEIAAKAGAKTAGAAAGSKLIGALAGGGQRPMAPMLSRGGGGPMSVPLQQVAPLSLSGSASGPNASVQRIFEILRAQGRV